MPTKPILSVRELALIQTDATAVCDQPVTIQHVTGSQGQFGQAKQTLGAATSVMALIADPSEEDLRLYGPKIGEHFAWRVAVPWGSDIRVGDQMTFANGIVCTVIGPDLIKSYPMLNEFIAVAVR